VGRAITALFRDKQFQVTTQIQGEESLDRQRAARTCRRDGRRAREGISRSGEFWEFQGLSDEAANNARGKRHLILRSSIHPRR